MAFDSATELLRICTTKFCNNYFVGVEIRKKNLLVVPMSSKLRIHPYQQILWGGKKELSKSV